MPSVAVTVVGTDRPGIVHRVTGAIADLGGNLEDSSMSLLRGHFAMTLIADLPAEPDAVALHDSLADLRDRGLSVSVLQVAAEEPAAPGRLARLSVTGADRPGIVNAATEVVLAAGGNIVDLSTRLGNDLYILTADVVLPPTGDIATISATLQERMAELGVRAGLTELDDDLL